MREEIAHIGQAAMCCTRAVMACLKNQPSPHILRPDKRRTPVSRRRAMPDGNPFDGLGLWSSTWFGRCRNFDRLLHAAAQKGGGGRIVKSGIAMRGPDEAPDNWSDVPGGLFLSVFALLPEVQLAAAAGKDVARGIIEDQSQSERGGGGIEDRVNHVDAGRPLPPVLKCDGDRLSL